MSSIGLATGRRPGSRRGARRVSGKVILRVAQSGLALTASRVALKYTVVMSDDTFEMVGLLGRKGNQRLARQMLARWAGLATAADETQLRTFVEEAAEAGDRRGTGKFLRAVARSGADVSMEGQLAEQLVDVFGMPALAAIRPFLSSEVLIRRPLRGRAVPVGGKPWIGALVY